MQNMEYYYDFSGQKFGYPLSFSINSFDRQVFSRIRSLEICYVLKGEYEVITEYFTDIIHEHELVLIAPDDLHKISKHFDGENVVLTLHIDFTLLPYSMVGNVKESFVSMICTEQKNARLLHDFRTCMGQLITLLQKGEDNLFELNTKMMEIISIASNSKSFSIEKLPLLSYTHENYMKAIQYVDAHYAEDLHLEDIAATLNFSISYASKLFKKYTQIPFVKYLSYVRVRSSLESLLEGKESIERIAQECGMPNTKSYTRSFKEMYGILPSSYRKQFKKNMRYNEENKDQKMTLDEKHISLLNHLLESQNTVYEDEHIILKQMNENYLCHVKDREVVLELEDQTIKIVPKTTQK